MAARRRRWHGGFVTGESRWCAAYAPQDRAVRERVSLVL